MGVVVRTIPLVSPELGLAANTVNYDKWAEILLDAATESDAAVAKDWDVSRQQVSTWRKAFREGEPNICAAVQRKEEERQYRYAYRIPAAIEDGIAFLRKAVRHGDATDPKLLEQVMTAVQQLHEAKLSHDVLKQRMQQNEPQRIEQLD